MKHEQEIRDILSRVDVWPEEDRVALAYQILRDMRIKYRDPPPRRTADRAAGLAVGSLPAPTDAQVEGWIAEQRVRKHG